MRGTRDKAKAGPPPAAKDDNPSRDDTSKRCTEGLRREKLLGSGFVEAVAEVGEDVGWDSLLDELAEVSGERCGDGDQDPEEHGEEQAGDGDGLERDGDYVGLMERQRDVQGSDVGYEFYAVDDDGGEQEGQDREGADAEEEYVDSAGEALAAAAVAALEEMTIVISAHGGREAGDIETPTGEDAADDGIGADVAARLTICDPSLVPGFLFWLRSGKW